MPARICRDFALRLAAALLFCAMGAVLPGATDAAGSAGTPGGAPAQVLSDSSANEDSPAAAVPVLTITVTKTPETSSEYNDCLDNEGTPGEDEDNNPTCAYVIPLYPALDYHSSALCGALGGVLQTVAVSGGNAHVCSEIDANDTFCIVGSRGAFPCRGLFKHVALCNSVHNRPALNPFFCGEKCLPDSSDYACGGECAEGEIVPPRLLPAAAGYGGELFRITARANPGRARFALTSGNSNLTVRGVWADGTEAVATVQAADGAGLLRDSETAAGGLRAEFSCGGWERYYGADSFAFTVSVVVPPSGLHFEVSADITSRLTALAFPGLRNIAYSVIAKDPQLSLSRSGEIRLTQGIRVGQSATLAAAMSSRDMLGTLVFTVTAFGKCVKQPEHANHRRTTDILYTTRSRAIYNQVHQPPSVLCNTLNRGGDPNYSGGLALYRAANINSVFKIKMLLDFGARLGAWRDRGIYAPVLGAASGHGYDALVYLNSIGADMRAIRNGAGDHNALHAIASSPAPSMWNIFKDQTTLVVRRLLAAGISQRAVDNYGDTPLIKATIQGNVRVVEALFDHGSNTTFTKRDDGRSAVHFIRSDDEMARLYVRLESEGKTDLNYATRSSDKKKWPVGTTPLDTTTHTSVAKILYDAGARCSSHRVWRHGLCRRK